MTKLCKDCKFYRKNWWFHYFTGEGDQFDKCIRPRENLMSGKSTPSYCSTQRENDYLCGKEGKFFEELK